MTSFKKADKEGYCCEGRGSKGGGGIVELVNGLTEASMG